MSSQPDNNKNTAPENNKTGSFVSFILLDKAAFDPALLAQNLQEDWGITVAPEDIKPEQGMLVTEINGMMAAFSLMPAPVPGDEIISNARTNFRWPEAVTAAESHKAHIIVALIRGDRPLTESAMLYVKLCSSCLKQPGATGINTLGSLLEPGFYIDSAEGFLNSGEFPLMNLVFFGLYSNDEGKTFCGYTYGLEVLGKRDMEVLDSSHSAQEVFELIYNISSYVIESDVVLNDGETIGFSAKQKLPITLSEGIAVPGDTLKIGF